jgi:predicted MPP superfamily phosphohydrolase
MTEDVLAQLEQRLGRLHARQRLGIETDYETRVFGHGLNFFHPENWYSIHSVLRLGLRMAGLYGRGRRNAEDVQVRRNRIAFADLPSAFEGFTILHMTDMHVEMNRGAMDRVIELLPGLTYDLCVLTGDFRAKTFGRFDRTLEALERICAHVRAPIYGVLGNHDTIRMVPGMEAMGIRMLLNEAVEVTRGNQRIHLAGIDDAHYYRVDNIQKTAEGIPHGEFSILLSHTPEIYRQAAHAGFRLLLGGHTHGGQICLPGAIPITLDSALPRRMGAGAWRYNQMIGYTSVGVGSCIVPVRLNCLPEIVLHRLDRAEGASAV